MQPLDSDGHHRRLEELRRQYPVEAARIAEVERLRAKKLLAEAETAACSAEVLEQLATAVRVTTERATAARALAIASAPRIYAGSVASFAEKAALSRKHVDEQNFPTSS